MAYTQAPVKRDMYMEIPKGFEVEGDGDYVLQILVAHYPFSLPSSGRRIYPVMGNYRVIFLLPSKGNGNYPFFEENFSSLPNGRG